MNNFLKQRYNKLIYALKDTFSEETAKRVYDKLMKDQLFYQCIIRSNSTQYFTR